MESEQLPAGKKDTRALRWVLIIGIVIVLNLLFNYLIYSFYTEPKYETFCPASEINIAPASQDECLAKGGQWNQSINQKQSTQSAPATTEITGTCDVTFTCQKEYQTARDFYRRNVFIILVVLGILAVVLGFGIMKISAVVSLGLALGGVLSFIVASMSYWSDMGNWLKVAILTLALAVLIWLGLKRFKD